MLCAPFVCFKCRNRFTDRPVDAQQDDVCARCLHDLRSDAFEEAFHAKGNAQAALDENPSDHALRRYRVAERGLRRIQDENRRRSDLAHARRRGASA